MADYGGSRIFVILGLLDLHALGSLGPDSADIRNFLDIFDMTLVGDRVRRSSQSML